MNEQINNENLFVVALFPLFARFKHELLLYKIVTEKSTLFLLLLVAFSFCSFIFLLRSRFLMIIDVLLMLNNDSYDEQKLSLPTVTVGALFAHTILLLSRAQRKNSRAKNKQRHQLRQWVFRLIIPFIFRGLSFCCFSSSVFFPLFFCFAVQFCWLLAGTHSSRSSNASGGVCVWG